MTRAARAMAPMTIPAIAPLDSPLLEFEAAAAGVPVEEDTDVDVAVTVLVGNEVMYPVRVGKTTPAHRCSAPEL